MLQAEVHKFMSKKIKKVSETNSFQSSSKNTDSSLQATQSLSSPSISTCNFNNQINLED